MNRKILTAAVLICVVFVLSGCSKYEPDYTIWREAVISDYEIHDDSIDITVDYAYMYRYYEAGENYQVYEAVCYGNQDYQVSRYYTIPDRSYTYTINSNEIDNFEKMCNFIKGADNKIIRLTMVNDRIAGIAETGYILYGRT